LYVQYVQKSRGLRWLDFPAPIESFKILQRRLTFPFWTRFSIISGLFLIAKFDLIFSVTFIFNTLRKNLGGGILLYSSHLRWLWLIHSYLVLELNFSLISQAELSQIQLYGPSFEDRLRANDWSTRDWLTFRIVIFYLEQFKIFQKVETINIKIFKIKYIDGKSF
jgi:hypothetical protein